MIKFRINRNGEAEGGLMFDGFFERGRSLRMKMP